MKKFLFKTLFFSLVLLVLLYLMDVIITGGLRKSESNNCIDWNRMYNGEINADIIINGDSKAWLQISPEILDTILNVNSYNLGIDGHDFYVQKHRYDIYEKNNQKPEIIIQVVGNTCLQKRQDLFNIDQFLPFIKDSTVKVMTENYVGFTFVDYHIPFVRYFGHTSTIINGFASFLGKTDLKKSNKYKGYFAYKKKWDNSFSKFKETNKEGKEFRMDSSLVSLFKGYVKNQTQQNVKLVLVYTPTFFESQSFVKNRSEIINFYKNIADSHQILFLDYSNLNLTKSTQFFYNSQHLNKEGSEIFSQMLAKDLKNYLSHIK